MTDISKYELNFSDTRSWNWVTLSFAITENPELISFIESLDKDTNKFVLERKEKIALLLFRVVDEIRKERFPNQVKYVSIYGRFVNIHIHCPDTSGINPLYLLAVYYSSFREILLGLYSKPVIGLKVFLSDKNFSVIDECFRNIFIAGYRKKLGLDTFSDEMILEKTKNLHWRLINGVWSK